MVDGRLLQLRFRDRAQTQAADHTQATRLKLYLVN